MSRAPATLRRRSLLSRGFTLVEVAVIIAVTGILAGALLPVISRPFVAEYRVRTIAEMQAMKWAIVGHPQVGNDGFLGTMGRLPRAALLSELWVQPGDVALVSQSATTGALAGWNGPYLHPEFHQPGKDAWGNDLVLELQAVGSSEWRLRSDGPDGTANTADDIILPNPTGYFESRGTLTVRLLMSDGQLIKQVPESVLVSTTDAKVVAYYPTGDDATEAATDCTLTLATGVAICADVPFGLRHIRVNSTSNLFPTVDVKVPVYRKNALARVFLEPSVTTAPLDSYVIPLVTPTGFASSVTQSPGAALVLGEAVIPADFPQSYSLEVQASGAVTPLSASSECTLKVVVDGTDFAGSNVTIHSGNATPMTFPFHVTASPAGAVDGTEAAKLTRSAFGNSTTVQVQLEATGGDCRLDLPLNAGTTFGMLLPHVIQ